MKVPGRDLLRGTLLAALSGGGAALVVRAVPGRGYHLGRILPVLLLAMVLAAWLIHLTSDGFFAGPARKPVRAEPPERQAPHGIHARFGEGILPRADSGASPAAGLGAPEIQRALLWAAAELALLSFGLR